MTGTLPASVQFEGLTKKFGEKTAVDAISFDIPAGSMFGILGPNGAGKSTLIRMATGLLRPDAGSVRIEEISVWEDPITAKSRIGVVPDDPTLFDRLSGRELIEFNGLLRRMDPATISHRRDELLKWSTSKTTQIPSSPITARGCGARSPSVAPCSTTRV